MSDELIEAMGPLPRTHGMLGAMLDSAEPHRTDDITADPRFRGWWPRAHPHDAVLPRRADRRARRVVIGALYLTEKEDGTTFSLDDQKVIELLAAHAAIAIENARLHERSRELSIVEERNRLARELHDSVTQRLFGVALAAESASTLLERDREGAATELRRVSELARGAMEELRAVVFELRPASLEAEGLATVLRKHVEVLRRVTGQRIELYACDVPQTRRRPRDGGAADRAGGARQRGPPRRRQAHRGGAAGARRTADPAGHRRRLRLRPGGAGGARPAARADLDGGARDRARRDVEGDVDARRRDDGAAGDTRVIRVLLADDHAVVRQGLRTFLDLQEDIEVVAEAGDGEVAVDAATRTKPDVILLDLVMPRLDGVGALKRLREAGSRARVIVLTSFGDDDKLFAALRAGAAGYLLKDVQPPDLVRAIRSVHDGDTPLSPTIATRVVEEIAQGGGAPADVDDLTPRERDVLILIARGRSNKVIALELGVAEKTVKTHVSHILGKLGLTDRTQAALYAVRHGLV